MTINRKRGLEPHWLCAFDGVPGQRVCRPFHGRKGAMEEQEADRRSGFVGRMEVVSGRTGRRSWPDDVKARIVSESFRPGAVVNDVARRHGLSPQQLTHWRRAARDGLLALPEACGLETPAFVPLQVSEPERRRADAAQPVEIVAGDVVIRLPADVSAARIADIVAALEARR